MSSGRSHLLQKVLMEEPCLMIVFSSLFLSSPLFFSVSLFRKPTYYFDTLTHPCQSTLHTRTLNPTPTLLSNSTERLANSPFLPPPNSIVSLINICFKYYYQFLGWTKMLVKRISFFLVFEPFGLRFDFSAI